MADHWEFVAAAYSLAAVVLIGYWRFLRQKERALDTISRSDSTMRSRQPSMTAHPRPEPGARPPLQ
jgi:hypothetical protein